MMGWSPAMKAQTVDYFEIDGVAYEIGENPETVYIAGRFGTSIKADLVLHSVVEYEGKEYKVTHMVEKAFQNCRGLVSVDMSDAGFTDIPSNAFYGCADLVAMVLPSTVSTIGDNAFGNCKITKVTIPETVQTIGASAFEGCPMDNLTINGAGPTMNVGDRAFYTEGQVVNVVTYRVTPPIFSSDDSAGFSEASYHRSALVICPGMDSKDATTAREAYRSANVWHNFYIDNPTALEEVSTDSVETAVRGGAIYAPAGSRCYTSGGGFVGMASEEGFFPAAGVYVVVTPSGNVSKVMVTR